MKRQALALLLILLIIVSTTAIVEIVSSASSSGWVEVYSFSGGFLIDNNAAFSTASFEVSHFEFRVRWSIDPDEVSENWYGSDFSFSVVHGARSTRETLGTVSGTLYSKTRNGIPNESKHFINYRLMMGLVNKDKATQSLTSNSMFKMWMRLSQKRLCK